MEMEDFRHYSTPSYSCFSALKDTVLPKLTISTVARVGFLKLPQPDTCTKILEADSRSGTIEAKMATDFLVGRKVFGPRFRIYCVVSGSKSCDVQIVAKTASMSDNALANFVVDTVNDLPIYGTLNRATLKLLKLYFDGSLVLDYRAIMSQEKISRDTYKSALQHCFKRILDNLQSHLGSRNDATDV